MWAWSEKTGRWAETLSERGLRRNHLLQRRDGHQLHHHLIPRGPVNNDTLMAERPFHHVSPRGTIFASSRCDFRDGVEVSMPDEADDREHEIDLVADVAEMIGFHAANILPELEGFQGYDALRWHCHFSY